MKKNFFAKRYQSLTTNPMGVSGDLAQRYANLVNFSLGDPDITTPQPIIEAAFRDASLGHTHYTHFAGDLELIDEILNFQREEYGLNLDRDNIFVTTSACHGMWLVLEALLDQGDQVIIPEPYFTPYPSQVEMCGGQPVFLPTYEENGFQIDIGDLKKAIGPRTKALILNTPNNPTGACLSRDKMIEIGRLAKEEDFLIIADDIYTSFSYEEDFVPIASLEDFFSHVITLRSFSKNFAMTGWRLGYIIGQGDLINVVKEINENNVFTAPSVSQRAGLHAIRMRKEVQGPIVEEFKKRTYHAYERIKRLKNVSILEPKGTFYLFMNIKKTGLTSEELVEKMIEEAQVLTIPGTAFGPSGQGYIRLAVTVGIEAIDQAFDRLEKMEVFR